MALKKCKECKADVSSKAKNCPQCGAPIKQSTSGCAMGCLALFLLALLFGGIVASTESPSSKSSQKPLPKTEKPSSSERADTSPKPSKIAPAAGRPTTSPSPPVEPDWAERKSYWRAQLAGSFSPPKPGASGKIRLASGEVQRGELVELKDDQVKLLVDGKVSIGYQREKLSPTSRAVFFETDFIEHNAKLKVEEEKADFKRRLADFQLEQKLLAERSAEAARKARIQNRVSNSDLLLGDWSWHQEYGFAIVEGQVKNISGDRLQNVEVVVSFYAADGQFITSDSSLVEYNPILPDQSTPFKAYATWNPAMSKASISFKTLFGGTVAYVSKKELAELEE